MVKQITEDYVSLEVAKALKEIGFNGKCHRLITDILPEDRYNSERDNWNSIGDCTSIPTQSLAQKWFREVHGIQIEINNSKDGYYYMVYENFDQKINLELDYLSNDNSRIFYKLYQDSLNSVLLEACKIVKQKQDETRA